MWQPKEELIAVLLSMGISRNTSERALFYTGNSSVESACMWLFDNPVSALNDEPLTVDEIIAGNPSTAVLANKTGNLSIASQSTQPGQDCLVESSTKNQNLSQDKSDESSSGGIPDNYGGPYKMVFVVNTELGMGVGKIAVQVAHATLGLYRILLGEDGSNVPDSQLEEWENYDGEKKIALRGENVHHLLDIEKQAKENGLVSYLVQDAGFTQIAAGSTTVLSIFGREVDVNKVTGKLKLL